MSIPMFNRDRKVYKNWKVAFAACINITPTKIDYA